MMIAFAGIYLLGVLVSSVSQVLLKKSAMKEYGSPIREYLNPYVIVAYIMFFGATILTIISYKVVPLSMGAILEATSYIYITIFGVWIFKERIGLQKAIALALIISGIIVYSLGMS